MKKLELIVTVGLPGSGKSTWAKEYVLKNQDTIRVNRDDIRHMLGKYWIPKREKLVTDIERFTVSSGLHGGYSVVVDATNFNHKYWEQLVNHFNVENTKYEVVMRIQDFTHVPVDTCILRDSKRENPVGEEVIRRMNDQYLKLTV